MKHLVILLSIVSISYLSYAQEKAENVELAQSGTYQFVFTENNKDPISISNSILKWIEENRADHSLVTLRIKEGVFVRIPSKEEIKAPDYELMSEYIVDADFKPILIQRK